ncbi:MAG: hypothetical protein FWE20_10000 [Defluviitaleaceae bacterium]|nr:hypothetical protein [Defluviitaleaceae bacterium]
MTPNKNISGIKSLTNAAPKLLGHLSDDDLTEALVYFTTALDETVDAVFLANSDPGFLTRECAEDLRLLQGMAQIVTEVAALQTIGCDGDGKTSIAATIGGDNS